MRSRGLCPHRHHLLLLLLYHHHPSTSSSLTTTTPSSNTIPCLDAGRPTLGQVSSLLKARAAGPYDTLKRYHIPQPVFHSPERANAAAWAGARYAASPASAASPYNPYHTTPASPY